MARAQPAPRPAMAGGHRAQRAAGRRDRLAPAGSGLSQVTPHARFGSSQATASKPLYVLRLADSPPTYRTFCHAPGEPPAATTCARRVLSKTPGGGGSWEALCPARSCIFGVKSGRSPKTSRPRLGSAVRALARSNAVALRDSRVSDALSESCGTGGTSLQPSPGSRTVRAFLLKLWLLPLAYPPYTKTYQHSARRLYDMIPLPHPARPGPSRRHTPPPIPPRPHGGLSVWLVSPQPGAPRFSRVHAQLTLSSSTARARGRLCEMVWPRAHTRAHELLRCASSDLVLARVLGGR